MKTERSKIGLTLTRALRPEAVVCSVGLALVLAGSALAQGPYPPTAWPPTIDPAKKVHYFVTDGLLDAPNANWNSTLGFVQGGDQATVDVTICGPEPIFSGKRASANPGYINIYDTAFQDWNTVPQIDILVQVYGDASVLNPANLTQARTWQAREGTTGSSVETGNSITLAPYATNAFNNKWNWILFSITNKVVNDGTGANRFVGSVPPGSAGNTNYGGLNGGTIRFGASSAQSYLNGVTIHAIAFGEAGAFGTTNDVNLFEAPAVISCDPVPDSNLVGMDFNAGVTNNLMLMNDGDQTVTFLDSVGPAEDKRKAVVPTGQYLNFGILNNYLGKPCNPNVTMKVCVDFYDDPNFAGQAVQFGPEAYATDALGCNPNSTYPSSGLHLMQGTGQWVRKSWTISGVNLLGVNTAPLTGGPRLICNGAPIAVSRFYLAVLRNSGPLAGQDPLLGCYADPLICQGVYGDFIELDLAKGITNGLDVGSNSGDQLLVVEESGPADDKRMSVRGNSPPAYNLNFVILTNALGPNSQGNLHMAITATYYDDPALVGTGFRPQVWKKEFGGLLNLAFMDPPHNAVIQGTGKWCDAYWEIGSINLAGVNQSPQAAARFEMGGPVHISRLRYTVVRPCGATAGQNLLETKVKLSAAPDTNSLVRLSWPYLAPQAQLQGSSSLTGEWVTVAGVPVVEGGNTCVFRLTNSPDVQFFRLGITPP